MDSISTLWVLPYRRSRPNQCGSDRERVISESTTGGQWLLKGHIVDSGDTSNYPNISVHFSLVFGHWRPSRCIARLCTSTLGLFYVLGRHCCQFTICSDRPLASQGRPHDRCPGSANHSAPRSTSVFS